MGLFEDYESTSTLLDDNILLVGGPGGTKSITAQNLSQNMLEKMTDEDITEKVKYNEKPTIEDFTSDDSLLVQTADGIRRIGPDEMSKQVINYIYDWPIKNNDWRQGVNKKSFCRGKKLGNYISDDQLNEIYNGTFRDICLGDYWTLGDIMFVVADFNPLYGKYNGNNIQITDHHIILQMMNTYVGGQQMNIEATNSTGYYGCAWRNYGGKQYTLNKILEYISEEQIMTYTDWLVEALNDAGMMTSYGFQYDCTVELPSLQMLYDGPSWYIDVAGNTHVIKISRFSKSPIYNFIMPGCVYSNIWLRDTYSNNSYFIIDMSGHLAAIPANADYSSGNPFFLLKGKPKTTPT